MPRHGIRWQPLGIVVKRALRGHGSSRLQVPGIFATSGQLSCDADDILTLDAAIAARVANGVELLSSELLTLQRHRAANDAREENAILV